MQLGNFLSKVRQYIFITAGVTVIIIYYFSLPSQLFHDPYATTISDSRDQLLGAVIASDQQWRFPPINHVPVKLGSCVTEFEDQYFYRHPGFNPVSLIRAAFQNIHAGHVVSGGSTLTMQVIRIYRQNRPRTYFEKILEILLSVRLELSHSKKEILELYLSHAPYGSNLVGAEAASWRYFNRGPDDLSWAEAALLAVLPNQPGLIFPGHNQVLLRQKRDRLLKKLLNRHIIDELTYRLSVTEPVPSQPQSLPSLAPRLLTRALQQGFKGTRLRTTLNRNIQIMAREIVERHAVGFRNNQVYNAAAIIMEVNSGKVLAYVGNTDAPDSMDDEYGNDVDIIMSPRSTGSVLKPLLFASMADEGILLPTMLVPDIPTMIDGFAPQNFSRTFDGAVPADEVIARSLNVPSVRLLKQYSYEKFHFMLKRLGMTTLTQPPGHYGLSLILGGAEGTLWDLSGIYASLGRELNHYFRFASPTKYLSSDIHPPIVFLKDTVHVPESGDRASGLINAGPVWMMMNVMTELNRPEEDASWRYYASGRRVAWKTGTSYGNRDAWSIGLDRNYLVGVWVGNADGEGRAGLIGVEYAAPLMFDLFNLLPRSEWFEKPTGDLKSVKICKKSGYLASQDCDETEWVDASMNADNARQCNFCKTVFLDPSGKFRVNADCEPVDKMIKKSWFVLPPVEEWYYKNHDPFYRPLPPYRKECRNVDPSIPAMALIYPKNYSRIYVPREINGEMGQSVFEVAHRNPSTAIYWHIDNQYIGMTRNIHQMGIRASPGFHDLVLVDENGEVLKIRFEVISGK